MRVHWCHPWQWRRFWIFRRRNHRKLLVVDSEAAYIGGFNLTQLNSRRATGNDRWRDTHVRLSGPIVDEAAAAYEAFGNGQLRWHGDVSRQYYLLTNHVRGVQKSLA